MKQLKTILLLIVGVVLWLPLSVEIHAVSNPTIEMAGVSSAEETKIETVIADTNEELGDAGYRDLLTCGSAGDVTKVTFDTTTYNTYSTKEKQEVMGIILTKITQANCSTTNRTKLYNFISKSDINTANLIRQLSNDVDADFAAAYSKYFQKIAPGLGVFMGGMVLAVFMLLGVTVAVDIAFITIPVLQVLLIPQFKNHKVRFVSIEAVSAVQQSMESIGQSDHQDSMQLYFVMKSKQFVAIALCLLYLAGGEIYNVLASIVDYVSSFI